MSKKIVTTINNEQLPISKCRCYNKKYYKIGDINVENSGDCYKIDDKFYRVETGQIVYNYTDKKYCLKNNSLIYGLIQNDKFGWFNNTKTKIKFYDHNNLIQYALNEEILKNNLNYREHLSSGDYYHISCFPAKHFNVIKIPNKEYKFSLPYDSKGITNKYLEIYNNLYDSKVSASINDLSNIIEDLTFGLEFETTAGFVPERITNKLGLIPLRDGSISGIEYVTVPLSGAKGLQTIVDITKELDKRTKFDYKCSLHLHLGNVPRTPEFILAFFKTTLFIQNELFTLFPLYKKYNLGIKNKNYSKPYDTFNLLNKIDPVINSTNITKNLGVLIDYLSGQDDGFFHHNLDNNLNNIDNHPQDSSGNQKWNITNRYYVHNFISLIFGNKQTIEFRIHTPTYDINKIFMFILINSILINFTKNYEKNILENPKFFDNYVLGLESIIQQHLINLDKKGKLRTNYSLNSKTFFESVRSYIKTRKKYIENLTRDGNIIVDEEDLKLPEHIFWNDPRQIETDYHKNKNIKLDSELDNIVKEETPVLKKEKDIFLKNPYIDEFFNDISINEKTFYDFKSEQTKELSWINSIYGTNTKK